MLAVAPFAGSAAPPRVVERPEPDLRRGEVLLEVRATAINRADLLQLQGLYPPPPGESEIPGLECCGEIVALGDGVEGWRVGDRVAALLAGGGHAECVAVPSGQLLALPDGWSFVEGAALMESALTAWTNLVVEGALQPNQRVLVTGATGGVGSFTVPLAQLLGGETIAASRPSERLDSLGERFGCALCELRDPAEPLLDQLGEPVDLILDFVSGPWLGPLLEVLARRGTLVVVGLMAGPSATIDLGRLLRERLRLVGSVLRARPREEKAELVRRFSEYAGPHLHARRLVPSIEERFPFDAIGRAYERIAAGGLLGKIVVER